MTSRPTFTRNGSQVTISIPPDWFANVSGISRKPYHQLMTIKPSIRGLTGNFVSGWGQSNVAMKDNRSGLLTFPIKQHDTALNVDLAFYYSEDQKTTVSEMKNNNYASSKVQVLESSKMATSSPDIPDYHFFFIFVEDTPDEKQIPGSGQYDDLAATVYLVKTNPNPIPPPPPPGTNEGYNNVLDLPRPSTIENYLKYYDTAFLIDDSGSMQGGKWTELNNALLGFSKTAIDYDADGIDLFFLNSDDKFVFKEEIKGVQDVHKVSTAMSKVTPNGSTPTGKRVGERMREFLAKLDSAVGLPRYSQIKPFDLICITDGSPNDADPASELGKVLVEISAQYRANKHHPNWMGIQFVQIGDDTNARDALQKLVSLETGSMVDTVPYAGPGSISPDKMERILLGGLHPNIRAQKF